ncbi:hypothetical protein KQI63_04080 [bacterium]|nr:hypothetical protein [bacterium]
MDDNAAIKPFRPWRTIWHSPRETVRLAITEQSVSQMYATAGLFAVFTVFDDWNEIIGQSMGSMVLQILAVIAAIGLTMVLMVEGMPRLLGWTSGIFQVYRPLSDIKRGFVTTLIPFLPFMLIGLVADRLEAQFSSTGSPDFGGGSWFALGGAVGMALPMMLLSVGVLIWLVTLTSRGMAELFGYSPWKAFVHLMVGWVLFVLAAIVIVLPIAILFD